MLCKYRTIRLNDQTAAVERVGGVKWVIKDGIVYDAKRLLQDVARMVDEAKRSDIAGNHRACNRAHFSRQQRRSPLAQALE